MRHRILGFRFFVSFAIFGALLVASGAVLAADYGNNTWTTTGKFKFQVKKVGKEQTEANATVIFTPTTFEIRGEDNELILDGGYTADAKGKAVLMPSPGSMNQFLNGTIQEILNESGYQGSILSTTVDKTKMTSKCKGSSKGVQLSLKMSIKADTLLDIKAPESMSLDAGVSVSLSLKGTIPPDISDSRWVGPGKSKVSIQGFGNAGGSGTLDLTFGPGGGVPAGEFCLLSVEDGIRLDGSYGQSGVTASMSGVASAFAFVIEQVVELETGLDVRVIVVSEDCTFKYKPGISGKLNCKIKYLIESDETEETLKANVKISGKLPVATS